MVLRNLIASAVMLGLAAASYADDEELRKVQERLEKLEKQQKASPSASPAWLQRLSFGGLVEVEGTYTNSDAYTGNDASDITVATVELGLGATITDNISAELAFLYEEDETDFEVDVATIAISELAGLNLNLLMGQFYQPFGSFETNMVNDTLVLELAETRETSVFLSWEEGPVTLGGYVFNGDVDSDEDTVSNFGLTAAVTTETFTAGIDYISNIYDSDAISEVVPGQVNSKKGAVTVHGTGKLGPVSLIGEYFIAEKFSAALGNARPEALQLEASIVLDGWVLAGSYQATDDSVALELPESRYSVSAGTALVENVTLAFEYWFDQDYSKSDGGTGNDAHSVVGQIAVLF